MATEKPPWFLVFGTQAGCGKTTIAQLFMRALLANSAQLATTAATAPHTEGLVLLRHRDAWQWPLLTTALAVDSPAVLSEAAMAAWFPAEMHGQPFEKQLERLDWWLAEQVRSAEGGVSVLWVGDEPENPALPIPWPLLLKGLQRLGQNTQWVVWDAPPDSLCESSVEMGTIPFSKAVPVWVLPAHSALQDVQSRWGVFGRSALAASHPVQVVLNHVYPSEVVADEKALMQWLQHQADGARYCGQLPHVPLNPASGTVVDALDDDFDTVLARMNTPLLWLGNV